LITISRPHDRFFGHGAIILEKSVKNHIYIRIFHIFVDIQKNYE